MSCDVIDVTLVQGTFPLYMTRNDCYTRAFAHVPYSSAYSCPAAVYS